MKGKSPISETIYQDLCKKILHKEIPEGSRLPTIRTLSKLYGVSLETLLSALDLLEKNNLVTRLERRGIYVGSGKWGFPEIPDKIQAFENRTEKIAQCILDDISQGQIQVGDFLPLQKILRYQYRTSKLTLSRALGRLVRKGIVHRKGSGYVVGASVVRVSKRTQGTHVYFIGEKASRLLGRMQREFSQAVQKELARFGVLHMDYLTDKRFGTNSLRLPQNSSGQEVTGYIYSSGSIRFPGMSEQQKRQLVQNDLVDLAATGVPTIIFEPVKTYVLQILRHLKQRSNIFLFCLDDMEAGEKTGFQLASLGHTRIAYLDFLSESHWSEQRLKGIEQGLRNVCGSHAKIERHRANADWHVMAKPHATLVTQLKRQKPGQVRFGGPTFSATDPRVKIYAFMRDLLMSEYCSRAMIPLFEKALASKTVTAWACVDPQVAVAALEFLREKRREIPEQIGLMCIDDNESTAHYGIDAYDFQIGKMGYLAAHSILGDIPIRKSRLGIVKSPGTMIARGSVCRTK